ncbi:MAG: DUF4215 domain-containing protein [Polyangiaceae bacterium]
MRAHRPPTSVRLLGFASLVALSSGCGARSSLPAPDAEPVCGDGVVDPGEECDDGPGNAGKPVISVRQGTFAKVVTPIDSDQEIVSFYSYSSSSGHTGLEAPRKSELFLHRHTATGTLSLVTEHGVDVDGTGLVQPETDVAQQFTGFPAGVSIAIADDNADEIHMDSASSAVGAWHFIHNTDGAAFTSLPFPGTFRIDVTSTFGDGITALRFIDGDGVEIPLDLVGTVSIVAEETPAACRPDCTLPRCGDGILDDGEACDDGNTLSGDGCSADCASTN